MDIALVGAIGAACTADAADVRATLAAPIALGRDEGWRGKVSTRLFASATHVLKLKSGFALPRRNAEEWCRLQLARERAYGIYPPHRHWLVLEDADGCAVGNLSQRGITLEQVLLEHAGGADPDTLLALLDGLFDSYFRFWQAHGLRQDEGLSNYIVEAGRVWYIDDDIYSPDNLVSFAHSLCGLIRRLPALDTATGARLAAALRTRLLGIDRLLPAILAEQMRDAFLPTPRSPVRHAMVDVLEQAGTRQHSAMADRVAVLADIHGNLPALEAVLADLQAQGLRQAIVLGDIVGYGPFPGECVDRLRAEPWIVLRGNHDHAAAEGQAGPGFSSSARWSTPWTVAALDAAQRQWLGALPLIWRDGPLSAVHGAPCDPTFFNSYVYPATAERNLDAMQEKGMVLCFHGHSHIPGAWQRNAAGIDRFHPPGPVSLDPRSRYLVCPGSVGQPRDGDIRAQYAVYDRARGTLEFRQLPYDRARLATAIRAHAFPDFICRQFQLTPQAEEA